MPDPFGHFLGWFWTILDQFWCIWTILSSWTSLFGPVYLDLSLLTRLFGHVSFAQYIWTHIFGYFFFYLSIWTHLIGPIYLDPSICTHLFGPVWLDPSSRTCLFGPGYMHPSRWTCDPAAIRRPVLPWMSHGEHAASSTPGRAPHSAVACPSEGSDKSRQD